MAGRDAGARHKVNGGRVRIAWLSARFCLVFSTWRRCELIHIEGSASWNSTCVTRYSSTTPGRVRGAAIDESTAIETNLARRLSNEQPLTRNIRHLRAGHTSGRSTSRKSFYTEYTGPGGSFRASNQMISVSRGTVVNNSNRVDVENSSWDAL